MLSNLTKMNGAGITLRRLPSNQLVQFGDVTASGNAVVRLEVQEVALFSSFWNVTGIHVPVCGEMCCPFAKLRIASEKH